MVLLHSKLANVTCDSTLKFQNVEQFNLNYLSKLTWLIQKLLFWKQNIMQQSNHICYQQIKNAREITKLSLSGKAVYVFIQARPYLDNLVGVLRKRDLTYFSCCFFYFQV